VLKAQMRGRGITALVAATAILLAGNGTSVAAESREPRIVGGQATTIESSPWQVAVADPPSRGGNGFQRQFCGGSLVAPTIVVTAAHCAYNPTAPLVCLPTDGFDSPASDFSVITGRTTLSSSAGAEIPVAEVYYFDLGPDGAPVAEAQSSGDGQGLFDCSTSQWDVAMLELASAAPPPAQPILIAGGEEGATWEGGRAAFVTGWGSTSEEGERSDRLLAAGVSMIADATCGSPAVYGSAFIPETMVCAGELAGGRDTCFGDSGGPLVVPINGGGERLVGDTSWGEGCGRPNRPGVYGRLADNPIRSTVRTAIRSIAGADVVGSGARPPGPPQTTITKAPKRKVTTRKRRVRARLAFTADEPASFECRLDRSRFKPCSSPFKRKVGRGKHRFRVRAADEDDGNVERPAAKHVWKVKRIR
jgi:hypothetical protein